MYLEEVKKQAEVFQRFTSRPFIPCTLEEVEGIKQHIKHRLPEAYREFLLWMGLLCDVKTNPKFDRTSARPQAQVKIWYTLNTASRMEREPQAGPPSDA